MGGVCTSVLFLYMHNGDLYHGISTVWLFEQLLLLVSSNARCMKTLNVCPVLHSIQLAQSSPPFFRGSINSVHALLYIIVILSVSQFSTSLVV